MRSILAERSWIRRKKIGRGPAGLPGHRRGNVLGQMGYLRRRGGTSRECHRAAHDPALLDFPGSPTDLRLVTLTRMAESGHKFVSLVLTLDESSVEQAIRAIGRHRNYFLSRGLDFVLVETVGDIERAKREGKLGIGIQAWHPPYTDCLQSEKHRRRRRPERLRQGLVKERNPVGIPHRVEFKIN